MDRTASCMSALPQSSTRVPTEVDEVNVTRYWIKGMKLILNLLIVTILVTLLVGVLKVFVDLWSVFQVPVEQVLRRAIVASLLLLALVEVFKTCLTKN